MLFNQLSLCVREERVTGLQERENKAHGFPDNPFLAKHSIFIQWKNKTRIKDGDKCRSAPPIIGILYFSQGFQRGLYYFCIYFEVQLKFPQ